MSDRPKDRPEIRNAPQHPSMRPWTQQLEEAAAEADRWPNAVGAARLTNAEAREILDTLAARRWSMEQSREQFEYISRRLAEVANAAVDDDDTTFEDIAATLNNIAHIALATSECLALELETDGAASRLCSCGHHNTTETEHCAACGWLLHARGELDGGDQ